MLDKGDNWDQTLGVWYTMKYPSSDASKIDFGLLQLYWYTRCRLLKVAFYVVIFSYLKYLSSKVFDHSPIDIQSSCLTKLSLPRSCVFSKR